MAEFPAPSLSRAREQKISELSTFFANDDLSLEDLERRIERVYKAANMAELETITADLQTAAKPLDDYARAHIARASPKAASSLELVSARVLSLMSSTRRVGRWAVPRHLDVVAIMSETRIDVTQASVPPGIVDIELRAVMASFKLIVPPGTRVIDETHSIMANVSSRADEFLPGGAPPSANAPVIRLTGFVMMADVSIVVRRREDPVYDDDDDD